MNKFIRFINYKGKLIDYKGLSDREIVDLVYNEYIKNLKRLVDSGGANIMRRRIVDIPFVDVSQNWRVMGDKYLEKTDNSRESLGRSIVKEGTYWPIIVRRDTDGKLHLMDGGHRIHSLRMLLDKGEINEDFTLPVLLLDETKSSFCKHTILNPKYLPKEFTDLYESTLINLNYDEDSNDLFLQIKSQYIYLMMAMMCISVRNYIFKVSEESGVFYPPSKKLNNKKEMKEYFCHDVPEELKSYLNDLYRVRYSGLLKTSPLPITLVNSNYDFIESPINGEKTDWGNNADEYLKLYENDIEGLARDIEENGTLFPLTIVNTEEWNKPLLKEGLHRIESFKEAGIDRNFMAIDLTGYEKIMLSNKPLYLKAPIEIDIPNTLHKHNGFYELYKQLGVNLHKMGENELGFTRVEIKTYNQWYRTHQLFSTAIRNMSSSIGHKPKGLPYLNPQIPLPKRFELEFFARCNRVCSWCPNSFIDRKNNYEEMDIDVLRNFLSQLKDMEWTGFFSLSRFNEPMSNMNALTRGIETIREYFPHSYLFFNTNGDYLTRENLLKLKGHISIQVTDYDERDEEFHANRAKELGLEPDLNSEQSLNSKEKRYLFKSPDGNSTLRILFNAEWSSRVGNMLEDRGNSLPERIFHPKGFEMKFKNNRELRDYPCYVAEGFNSVDWNGNIMPCCHLRSDYEPHKQHIFGNIKNQSLKEIYSSEKVSKFIFRVKNKDFPDSCKTCHKGS